MTPSQVASLELIEAELARRPVGATIREVPPVVQQAPAAELPIDWHAALPAEGAYRCATKCGATIARPGVCGPCGRLREEEDARAEFAAALDSVPPKFRWARAEAPELAARLQQIMGTKVDGPLTPAAAVEKAAVALMTGRLHTVTIYGPNPDAGKTSLACAIFHTIVQAAIDAWLGYYREIVASREGFRKAEPRLAGFGRGARFIAARDLASSRDRGADAPPPAFARARAASFLLLDELGQEIESRDDGYSAASRAKASTDVLAHRWDLGLPTLITTPFSTETICKIYGGSIEKRTAKGREASVLRIG